MRMDGGGGAACSGAIQPQAGTSSSSIAPAPSVGTGVGVVTSSCSSSWGSTNLTSKPEECSSSTEREARSVALEKAYVHDVYQQIACHFSDSRYRAWPRVKQFLLDLEPGSFVCDVGCGNGKYLSINPSIYKIGLDRCSNLANIAREKEHEVMICDNLALPFRDECFDAGLSIAVIHHFATTERRVAALKELARVLRIGGKLMVSVWAMEQRHRKFESQDVLVPWNRPMTSSSDDKTSSIERDLNSTTTTTSDDDATHYHAYTQTSDSDSFPSMHGVCRKRGRVRHHRGRSIDPTCPSSSQSSSDLSSPNESCYSFVRRALQKLAGTRRNRGGRRPWFLQGLDIAAAGTDEIVGAAEHFAYMDCGDDIGGCLDYHHHLHRSNEGVNNGAGGGANGGSVSLAENLIPIELRQLESTEYADLFQQPQQNSSAVTSAPSKAALLFSNVLYPRRRRTLETTCGDMGHSSEAQTIGAQPKSKSLSDLLGLLPVGLLRSSQTQHRSKHEENGECRKKRHHSRATGTSSCEGHSHHHTNSNGIPLVQSYEDVGIGPYRRHVSVQTECRGDSFESTSETTFHLMFPPQPNPDGQKRRGRPLLVKQKHSICSDPEEEDGEDGGDEEKEADGVTKTKSIVETEKDKPVQDQLQVEPKENGELRSEPTEKRSPRERVSPKNESESSTPQPHKILKHQKKSIAPCSIPFWKQTSMNDELIFSSERLKEKERLKQQVQKQCSLNEELIYNKRRGGQEPPQENTRWDQMKEAFLKNSSNVKCFQLIKNGLSRGFRGAANEGGTPTGNSSNSVSGTACSSEGGQSTQETPPAPSGGTPDSNSSSSSAALNGDHSSTGGGNSNGGGEYYCSQQPSQPQPRGGTTSLRNGIVRMLQNWKQSEDTPGQYSPGSPGGHRYTNTNSGSSRRALFPPFFLRRSSAGSLTLVGKQGNKQDHHHHPHHLNHHGQCSSPGPLSPLNKGVTDSGELNGSGNGSSSGNKLLPGVRHVRKLSREDGSDSSKDSSFQSDTSVDSEDSFASVIFIPKSSGGLDDFGAPGDFCGTRANSTDSDRSPKSPASRLSPPNHGNLPKSPSPLAQEVQVIMRKKSPEVSPAEGAGRHLRLTPGGTTSSTSFVGSGGGEVTKFLFDETATTKLLAAENSGCIEVPQTVISPEPGPIINDPLLNIKDTILGQHDSEAITQMEQEQSSATTTSSSPPPTRIIIPSSSRSLSSGKKRVEKIEVLRKPGVIPEGKSGLTRQLVRRSLPKALAVELFNPETDDADTSDTSSSSPNSVSSVVSVVNEDSSAGGGGTTSGGGGSNLIDEAKQPIITEEEVDEIEDGEESEYMTHDDTEEGGPLLEEEEEMELILEEENETKKSNSGGTSILDVAASVVSSLENLVTHSSPKARRKITLAKLGSTSEWLSSFEVTSEDVPSTSASKKSSFKSMKKGLRSSADESTMGQGETGTTENTATTTSGVSIDSNSSNTIPPVGSGSGSGGQLSVEMLEERDSLFDSMENLTSSNNSKQQPSRNPSIDSSVRMSSTCSCSIRGGDSFDSWTSAKSSLTNSSCTQPPPPLSSQHKTSLTSMVSLPISGLPPGSSTTSGSGLGQLPSKMSSLDSNGTNKGNLAGSGSGGGGSGAGARRREAQSRIRVQSSSKSSSAAGEDTEDSTALTCHRYYHVFREGELDKLIEKYVQNLHIISSYYDHANWCIIAEKVQVWTI